MPRLVDLRWCGGGVPCGAVQPPHCRHSGQVWAIGAPDLQVADQMVNVLRPAARFGHRCGVAVSVVSVDGRRLIADGLGDQFGAGGQPGAVVCGGRGPSRAGWHGPVWRSGTSAGVIFESAGVIFEVV